MENKVFKIYIKTKLTILSLVFLRYAIFGTKMFNYVVNEFKNNNKTKMVLWCLKDNEPSKKFYTKMGGKIVKEKNVDIGDKQYKECCFEYDI